MPDCNHKPKTEHKFCPTIASLKLLFLNLIPLCDPFFNRFDTLASAKRSRMIFRRRRTRIEIEHTTVRVSGDDLTPVVVPPAPSPAEPTLARVVAFPARETNATTSRPTIHEPAKETRP